MTKNDKSPSAQKAAKGTRRKRGIDAQDLVAGMNALFGNEFFKYRFSLRERQIAKRLLNCETSEEIARSLHLSLSSVKYHIGNLYRKTGATTRSEFARCIRKGVENSRCEWNSMKAFRKHLYGAH